MTSEATDGQALVGSEHSVDRVYRPEGATIVGTSLSPVIDEANYAVDLLNPVIFGSGLPSGGPAVVSIVVSIGGRRSTTFVRVIPGNRAVCQRSSGMVPYFSPSHGCLTSACSGRALASLTPVSRLGFRFGGCCAPGGRVARR
jgi:hypothetical protein